MANMSCRAIFFSGREARIGFREMAVTWYVAPTFAFKTCPVSPMLTYLSSGPRSYHPRASRRLRDLLPRPRQAPETEVHRRSLRKAQHLTASAQRTASPTSRHACIRNAGDSRRARDRRPRYASGSSTDGCSESNDFHPRGLTGESADYCCAIAETGWKEGGDFREKVDTATGLSMATIELGDWKGCGEEFGCAGRAALRAWESVVGVAQAHQKDCSGHREEEHGQRWKEEEAEAEELSRTIRHSSYGLPSFEQATGNKFEVWLEASV